MLGRRNVAQEIRSEVRGQRASDRACDVVIPCPYVAYQRSQNIERCPLADRFLDLHISLYLIQRDMSWAFHNGLHARLARSVNESA